MNELPAAGQRQLLEIVRQRESRRCGRPAVRRRRRTAGRRLGRARRSAARPDRGARRRPHRAAAAAAAHGRHRPARDALSQGSLPSQRHPRKGLLPLGVDPARALPWPGNTAELRLLTERLAVLVHPRRRPARGRPGQRPPGGRRSARAAARARCAKLASGSRGTTSRLSSSTIAAAWGTPPRARHRADQPLPEDQAAEHPLDHWRRIAQESRQNSLPAPVPLLPLSFRLRLVAFLILIARLMGPPNIDVSQALAR